MRTTAPPSKTPPPVEVPEALSFTAEEERAFLDAAPYLRRNPRHLKRLVNVYALVRSLATLRGEQQLLDDPSAAVLWLARSLNMSVVAEGVEDVADWTALCRTDCAAIQGYFYSPPVPPEDFAALLRQASPAAVNA